MEDKNLQKVVNEFVARTDLNEVEQKLRAKLIATDTKLAAAKQELAQLSQKAQEKQAEIVNLTGQFDGLLTLAAEIQEGRAGPPPLQPVPAE